MPELKIENCKMKTANCGNAKSLQANEPPAIFNFQFSILNFQFLIVAVALVLTCVPACAKAQAPSTPPAPSTRPPTASGDIELVERLLAARRDYQATLEQLRAYYQSVGDVERMHWAEDELRQYHRIAKRAFRLELDVPPPTLTASQNVPEANELYRRAMVYKDHGWGNDYTDNQRRTEILLQQLLTNYPQSNKISDAAYQLGDLYESKAYRQYQRAAEYFERCFQWNPNTHLDARLRAARLYDRQLTERAKAMELYREVASHETDPKRIQEAQKRLAELSGSR
jgi:tetratricopeptide (TPR) repeat protein